MKNRPVTGGFPLVSDTVGQAPLRQLAVCLIKGADAD